MKALSNQDPGQRPLPSPDERNILLEQIRTKVSQCDDCELHTLRFF